MCENKKRDNFPKSGEEDNNMAAILEKKRIELQRILDNISAKAPVVKTKNGMIELDPDNPHHKKWYEED